MAVDGAAAPDAGPSAEGTAAAPVKDEPAEAAPAKQAAQKKLGRRHFDLVYHSSKTEMTCRMC